MRWRARAGTAPDRGDLTVFLDEAAAIEGRSTFAGTAMVNGRVTGELTSTGTLIIGEKGVVHASVQGVSVLVHGEVVGNLAASERIELRGGARVFGDVEAPVLIIEEGALFEGHCRMTRGRPAEAAPPRDGSVVPFKR